MSDLLESQDIFYPRNFDYLHRKVSFFNRHSRYHKLALLLRLFRVNQRNRDLSPITNISNDTWARLA